MYLQYGRMRQVSRGRPLESERPEPKIMNMIPEDGTPIPLTKIRGIATGKDYRMSASTLTKSLRRLVQAGKLKRTVDASGGRPRYLYGRTLIPPPGKVSFDDWFEPRLLMLKLMLMDGMSEILAHPHKDLDQAINGTMFGFIQMAAHSDLADFQKLVRSRRITKTEALLDQFSIRDQWCQALELDRPILPTSP